MRFQLNMRSFILVRAIQGRHGLPCKLASFVISCGVWYYRSPLREVFEELCMLFLSLYLLKEDSCFSVRRLGRKIDFTDRLLFSAVKGVCAENPTVQCQIVGDGVPCRTACRKWGSVSILWLPQVTRHPDVTVIAHLVWQRAMCVCVLRVDGYSL